MNWMVAANGDAGLIRYLKHVKSAPMLSEDEEYALAVRWRDESDVGSAQKLVMSHLRLVVKIAQKFKGYGLPMMDIISEGNIGLMKAVKKFDPDLGYRLATYAMWWIKATIQDYVLRSWSMVKIGTSALQKKLFFNLKKIKQVILNSDKNLESDVNLLAAEKLGVSKSMVDDMSRSISGNMLSLQDFVHGDDDTESELIDYVAASENVEDALLDVHDKNNMMSKLANAIGCLSEREREIIKARKLSDVPATLEKLSSTYNISRERIRQIEEKALLKLKKIMSDDERMLQTKVLR